MNNELNNKTEKKVRLDTARHVKRFLQSVINDYNNDLIPDTKAKTLSTLMNSFIKLLDVEKLQTTISNETELNFIIEKINEYLKPSEKKVSIVTTIEKPISDTELKANLEMMVHILDGKIIWGEEELSIH